jgi:transposase
MAAAIHEMKCSETVATLYLALELSSKKWQLALSTTPAQAPRECTIAAGDGAAFEREVAKAKQRFGLPAEAPVRSCYEAGRDGFWVARWLAVRGVVNVVVDSASIEVPRRARRTKTDRLDARGLLRLLMRASGGERRVWREVSVPSEDVEDRRHVHRALDALKRDRTRVINRIRGLLMTQGVRTGRTLAREVAQIRRWDGAPLPDTLRQRLELEWAHIAVLTDQIHALEARQRADLRAHSDAAARQVDALQQLRGIGVRSASLFVMEAFSWRRFRNRREIAALSGLAPTPFQSGSRHLEQGISKTGNRRWRAMAIEIAWGWLRFQRRSALAEWYYRRFAAGGPRARRIGVVAVARKLLIALWRYLERGVVPAGAVLKAA